MTSRVHRAAVAVAVTLLAGVFATAPAVLAAEEPASLNDAVAHIKWMVDRGDSKLEIAREVSRLVDQRVRNSNTLERMQDPRNSQFWKHGTWDDPDVRLDKFRASKDWNNYEKAAQFAWRERYGACEECTCLTYYLLRKSGAEEEWGPIRMIGTTAGRTGHNFVLWCPKEGADLRNPQSWGDGAWVVDGWKGRSLTSRQAYKDGDYYDSGDEKLTEITYGYDKTAKAWKTDTSSSTGPQISAEECCSLMAAAGAAPVAGQLDVLRDFRDESLALSAPGRAATSAYYAASPPLARAMRSSPALRVAVREMAVEPLVALVAAARPLWEHSEQTAAAR